MWTISKCYVFVRITFDIKLIGVQELVGVAVSRSD